MKKIMSKKLNKRGFTILELLVVVAIIAVLAVIATPQFLGAIDKSRVSAEIADLNAVSKAASMYNFDNSEFPADEAGFGTYINAFPAYSKWDSGCFNYVKSITNTAEVASTPETGAFSTADLTALGLTAGQTVIIANVGSEATAAKLDLAIDQAAGVNAGMVRTLATTNYMIYVIK